MKRGITAVACGLAWAATGVELPSSQPEAEGMSADRLDRVTAVARRYVQAGELPGAMTVVARNGTIVHARQPSAAVVRTTIGRCRQTPSTGCTRPPRS